MAKIKWKNKSEIEGELKEQETLQKQKEQTTLAIKLIAPTFSDEVLSQVPLLIDEWAVGVDYVADKSVVRYEDAVYRVITSHRSQADWTPDVALSVFSRVSRPGEIPAWKHGSYTKGMKVTHNGFTWESVIDNNVWEPGTVDETIWKKTSGN
jgi:hypothetical protein